MTEKRRRIRKDGAPFFMPEENASEAGQAVLRKRGYH